MKFVVFWMVCMYGNLVLGASSAVQEILEKPLIRQIARVVARSVYDSTGIQVTRDVRRGYPGQPSDATVLESWQLEQFFNDGTRSLEVNYNSFEVERVKGHLFTIRHPDLRGKIFIGFPGSQDGTAWNKNLRFISPVENVQGSYKKDIHNVFRTSHEMSLPQALDRHIRFVDEQEEIEIPNYGQHEYYFIGHSRGGGLALLAAERFKQMNNAFEEGRIKVVTFSAPRLSNAFDTQRRFVRDLGFENIIHFVRPFDVGPLFPFKFVENYGVKIPLVQSQTFFNVFGSHRMPGRLEVDKSIEELVLAKRVGWFSPLRSLFFPIEPKPLLWGIGGLCLGCVVGVLAVKTNIIDSLEIMRHRWTHPDYVPRNR